MFRRIVPFNSISNRVSVNLQLGGRYKFCVFKSYIPVEQSQYFSSRTGDKKKTNVSSTNQTFKPSSRDSKNHADTKYPETKLTDTKSHANTNYTETKLTDTKSHANTNYTETKLTDTKSHANTNYTETKLTDTKSHANTKLYTKQRFNNETDVSVQQSSTQTMSHDSHINTTSTKQTVDIRQQGAVSRSDIMRQHTRELQDLLRSRHHSQSNLTKEPNPSTWSQGKIVAERSSASTLKLDTNETNVIDKMNTKWVGFDESSKSKGVLSRLSNKNNALITPMQEEPLVHRIVDRALYPFIGLLALILGLMYYLFPRQRRLEQNSTLNSARELRFLRRRAKQCLQLAASYQGEISITKNPDKRTPDKKIPAKKNVIRYFDTHPSSKEKNRKVSNESTHMATSNVTVVLLTDDEENLAMWGFVTAQLSSFARVVVIQRNTQVQIGKQRPLSSYVSDIDTVLQHRDISGDLILVGDSIAGWGSLLWQGRHVISNQISHKDETVRKDNPWTFWKRFFSWGHTSEKTTKPSNEINVLGSIVTSPSLFIHDESTMFRDSVKLLSMTTHSEAVYQNSMVVPHLDHDGALTMLLTSSMNSGQYLGRLLLVASDAEQVQRRLGDQYIAQARTFKSRLSQLDMDFLEHFLPHIHSSIRVMIPHPSTAPWDMTPSKLSLLTSIDLQAANVIGYMIDPDARKKKLFSIEEDGNDSDTETTDTGIDEVSPLSEKLTDLFGESNDQNWTNIMRNAFQNQSFIESIALRCGMQSIVTSSAWQEAMNAVQDISDKYKPILVDNTSGNLYHIALQAPSSIVDQVQDLIHARTYDGSHTTQNKNKPQTWLAQSRE